MDPLVDEPLRTEPDAAPSLHTSADGVVDRSEGSLIHQVLAVLAFIGCVFLYVLSKRWWHRRAVALARQESEEMQRSPRHFTAEK